jgi:hypothetical protein
MTKEVKEALLVVLRKEERRMEDEYSHLSRSPEPLKKVRDAIRKLGGYK